MTMDGALRLDKLLGLAGVARSEAKKRIAAGRVTVDGQVRRDPGFKARPEQVALDGAPLQAETEIYLMLNKPAGVVTATEDKRLPTVVSLLPEKYARRKIGPVGRLDRDVTGLVLLTTGIFFGAVWANESWGRYWGWDPKETWALITMVVYAVVTHLHLVKRWNSLWLFNLASVIAFASVLMTFFGVNYFLSGMHSYGQNDNVHGIFTYLYIALGVVVVLADRTNRRWKTKE